MDLNNPDYLSVSDNFTKFIGFHEYVRLNKWLNEDQLFFITDSGTSHVCNFSGVGKVNITELRLGKN